MSPRVLILALFFAVGLLPQGWNKFDISSHATLLYGLGALIIALLFLSWREILKQKFESGRLWTASNIVKICGILLSVLFMAAFVTSPIQNLGWSEAMVMIAGVGIFFMTQTFNEKEQKDMVHTVLALAVACATLGLTQYLFRTESRIAGPFFEAAIKSNYWPNAFAMMLLTCWPLALTIKIDRVFEVQITRSRVILVDLAAVLKSAAIVITIAALFLTFSRAAFLVLLGQLAILIYLVRSTIMSTFREIFSRKKLTPQNRRSLIFTITTLALTFALVFTLQTLRAQKFSPVNPQSTNSFLAKASFSGTEQQTSVLERWHFMKGAIRLTLSHPFLGSGPFSFRFLYPKIQTDLLAISDHPHNWYLKIALEEGVPTALIFIALIGTVFYIRRELFTQKGITLSAVIVVALMGPLVHNLVDYNMNFLTNQILFWTFLGFLLARRRTQPPRLKELIDAEKPQQNSWPSILAVGVLITGTALLFEGIVAITHHNELARFARGYYYGEAKYAITQGNVESAIANMKHHLSLNPYDAAAWNYLGKIEEPLYPESALKSYTNAVKNDPANLFVYYVDYLHLAQGLQGTDSDLYKTNSDRARALLLTYPEMLKANIHFTARTENAQDSIKLARLLGDLKLNARLQRALRDFNRKNAAKTVGA